MKIEELIRIGSDFAENFRGKIGARNVNFEENRKQAIWSVCVKGIKIEFVLTKKETIIVPAATLFSRVYFDMESNRFFHIPEFVDKLDAEDLHCYYFPYIESRERFENCFGVISEFYIKNIDSIASIASDGVRRRKLFESKEEEMLCVMGFKEKEIPTDETEKSILIDSMMNSYENNVLLLRYTKYEGYVAFLSGKYDKAKKMYAKLGRKDALLRYEKHIVEYMEGADEPYPAIKPECASYAKANSYISGKENNLFMLKAFPVCFAVSFAVFAVVVFATRMFLSQGTVYYNDAGAMLMALLFALLCGLFGAMTFRRPLMKLLAKKNEKDLLAYDDIANSTKTNKFINIFFEIVFLACLALTVWFANMHLACYEDKMVYNPGEAFFSFETETKYYADITEVYYVDGLYNDYGEWIDRSSYVICFKDGTTFDTDGFFSEKEARENFIPVLSDYFDEIKTAKTAEDITLE